MCIPRQHGREISVNCEFVFCLSEYLVCSGNSTEKHQSAAGPSTSLPSFPVLVGRVDLQLICGGYGIDKDTADVDDDDNDAPSSVFVFPCDRPRPTGRDTKKYFRIVSFDAGVFARKSLNSALAAVHHRFGEAVYLFIPRLWKEALPPSE